jgi:hypothetical protein
VCQYEESVCESGPSEAVEYHHLDKEIRAWTAGMGKVMRWSWTSYEETEDPREDKICLSSHSILGENIMQFSLDNLKIKNKRCLFSLNMNQFALFSFGIVLLESEVDCAP